MQKIFTIPAARDKALSDQDIQDAFSANAATYGATINDTKLDSNNILTIDMDMPDAKTGTQEQAFLDLVYSDLGGEVTIPAGAQFTVGYNYTPS